MGHHLRERAVFLQPFNGRFGANFRHPRHVVHGIADQRLVIQHQVRWNAKLGLDAGQIAALVVHGVQDQDALIDQLRQIFVATANHYVHALLGGQMGQCANDVVGFHARHVQHFPAQVSNHFVDGLNLAA